MTILPWLISVAFGCITAAEQTIDGGNSMIDWAGRINRTSTTVSFDWLGVTARIAVRNAKYVTATIQTTSPSRGTRMRVFMSDQGYDLYPEVQFWVTPYLNTSVMFASNSPTSTLLTMSNIVDPQYGTGITTVVSFATDGSFVPATPQTRRMEFIGDSITAATNVVRPAGAPKCGDGGYQSDWTQTYSALLCQHFGASCSTVAVGGKCMLRECGGLQMPDYFLSTMYAEAPNPTYPFVASGFAPDAMVIDLGTNDERIMSGSAAMTARFTEDTIAFMKNATTWYHKPDIQFFLTSGPMENSTMNATLAAVTGGVAAGLQVTWIDMRTACVAARLHAPDNTDGCDGCASHPGIEGHRGMYEAAEPVIAKVMGWNPTPVSAYTRPYTV